MTGRIKGAAFREYVAWLRRRLGAAELERIVASLPPRLRETFAPGQPHLGILGGSWYDGEAVGAFMDELTRGRSDAEIELLAREGGVAALESTLTGVHKALIRVVGSPELHARFAQRLWDAYYEEGRVESVRVERTRQRIAYSEWRSHHPFLCRVTTASDLVVFRLMGLPDVRVTQESCVRAGASACAHFVDWG